MKIVKISPEDWFALSKEAHLVVFDEEKDHKKERINFALIGEIDGTPALYLTVREAMSDYAYLPAGGFFPLFRGIGKAPSCFKEVMEYLRGLGYNKVSFFVENKNFAMLKVALDYGMEIIGVRHFKGDTLVEFFSEDK